MQDQVAEQNGTEPSVSLVNARLRVDGTEPSVSLADLGFRVAASYEQQFSRENREFRKALVAQNAEVERLRSLSTGPIA